MNTLYDIYEKLKDSYDLTLANAFSLDAGFSEDFEVLTGTSSIGTFYLYDDGDLFVFLVTNKEDTAGTHWHPSDLRCALDNVVKFMEGELELTLYPFPQDR